MCIGKCVSLGIITEVHNTIDNCAFILVPISPERWSDVTFQISPVYNQFPIIEVYWFSLASTPAEIAHSYKMQQLNSVAIPVNTQMNFLESFPPELLHQIFDHVLPHDLTFSFSEEVHSNHANFIWTVFAATGNHAWMTVVNKPPRLGRRPWYADLCGICRPSFRCIYSNAVETMDMALLRVSKAIANESRGMQHPSIRKTIGESTY